MSFEWKIQLFGVYYIFLFKREREVKSMKEN